mmetsp:Transcript_105171/g.297570  ORF Transcript_105171/g.297570 Transcript_105171/m.297570 type:complete len:207 (-) Transcript_105171:198-818(-)
MLRVCIGAPHGTPHEHDPHLVVWVEARLVRCLLQAEPQAHPEEEAGRPRRGGRGGRVDIPPAGNNIPWVVAMPLPDQLLQTRDVALYGVRQSCTEVVGAVEAYEGEGGPVGGHVGGAQALEGRGVCPEDYARDLLKRHRRRMRLPRGPPVLRPKLNALAVPAQPEVLPPAADPRTAVAVLVDLEAFVEEEEHLAVAALRQLRPVTL